MPTTESWQPAGVRRLVTCPGLYSVRLSYFDNSSARARKWSKIIILAEETNISCFHLSSLQARYRFKETSKVLDLEKDVSPFVFQESDEFWNAVWLIVGLWPHEKIRVHLSGDGENYSQVLSATSSGSCEIPISTFEPYLLSRESARLSIQRQGFICQYELATLLRSPNSNTQKIRQEQEKPIAKRRQRPAQRRRIVDRLELVVHGDRNFDVQRRLVEEFTKLMEEHFGNLDGHSTEYPDGKFARGNRFVFHRMSFADLENESKEELRVELDSLVGTIGVKSGLAFSAEWSRAKE